ncbi:flavodoxin domain-containing protein [Weizmannia acidilactici]|uniref:flavodoxin domain-containing protein n=1 Tax=Weizmannia acidilactici TaxID=2607726 RepID=UPI00124F6C17|nr:flavodoxin domain-containing protein [Weizmannia acidilactici]GER73709.1 flavodoxin [Weizmannia acidilactici]
MNNIVVYASKHGTVEGIVRSLLRKSPEEILSINILKEEPPNLSDYKNIMIGGSIYLGKIQKPLTKFIKHHLDILLQKRVGLFLCAGETDRKKVIDEFNHAFPEALRKHAVAKEVLGYAYKLDEMNFLEKMLVKKMRGVTENTSALNEEGIERFFDTVFK